MVLMGKPIVGVNGAVGKIPLAIKAGQGLGSAEGYETSTAVVSVKLAQFDLLTDEKFETYRTYPRHECYGSS